MKKATKESVMFKLVEKWQKSASGAVEEIYYFFLSRINDSNNLSKKLIL